MIYDVFNLFIQHVRTESTASTEECSSSESERLHRGLSREGRRGSISTYEQHGADSNNPDEARRLVGLQDVHTAYLQDELHGDGRCQPDRDFRPSLRLVFQQRFQLGLQRFLRGALTASVMPTPTRSTARHLFQPRIGFTWNGQPLTWSRCAAAWACSRAATPTCGCRTTIQQRRPDSESSSRIARADPSRTISPATGSELRRGLWIFSLFGIDIYGRRPARLERCRQCLVDAIDENFDRTANSGNVNLGWTRNFGAAQAVGCSMATSFSVVPRTGPSFGDGYRLDADRHCCTPMADRSTAIIVNSTMAQTADGA